MTLHDSITPPAVDGPPAGAGSYGAKRIPDAEVSPEVAQVRPRAGALRLVFVAAGLASLGLGIVGIFLPVLPTTPLVLLAAFFFARGSPRLHAWLLRNPVMGPLIVDWQRNGVIRLRAKLAATGMIVPLCAFTVGWVPVAPLLKVVVVACCSGVLVYLWSRPSRPPQPEPAAAPAGP